MSARNPRIHGAGEPWATLAWALAGSALAPVTLWIVREICMAALAAMEGA